MGSSFSHLLLATAPAFGEYELHIIDEFEVKGGQGSHTAMGKVVPQRPGLHQGPAWALQVGSSALAQWGCLL